MKQDKPQSGLEIIAAERQRQIVTKGYSADHDDDEHADGSLAMAAVCYATPERIFKRKCDGEELVSFKDPWPWDKEDIDHSIDPLLHSKQRIRELAKAGALIAAEIDRLQLRGTPELFPTRIRYSGGCQFQTR